MSRGFGSPNFDPELRRKIASMGGKASHAKGTAREWTVDEARAAGSKGGQVTAQRRRARIDELFRPPKSP